MLSPVQKRSPRRNSIVSPTIDRYIPYSMSKKAYKASLVPKSLESEKMSSNIQAYIATPQACDALPPVSFFHELRSTGHYDSIGAIPETQMLSTSSEQLKDNDPEFGKASCESLPPGINEHRTYIAKSLGFQSPSRVYDFKADHFRVNSSDDIELPLKLDVTVSTRSPVDARFQFATQIIDDEVRLAEKPSLSIKAKTNIPYRVLDAPCLRNDFYSNLISWSKTTGNVVVGLGCSVYMWSEIHGAVPVLNHQYLHSKHDLVTVVSFCPQSSLFVAGTKQGRLLLFDQNKCVPSEFDTTAIPLCHIQSSSQRGISCIEWYTESYSQESETIGTRRSSNSPTFLIAGEESGQILYAKISGCRLEFEAQFKAQSQQICGLSLNETTKQLAIGGNDNCCTLWDLSDWNQPCLQYVLPHKAAVKAVAFCPWSRSLLATGGGSKDRTIKFWHTATGSLLHEIQTTGQVTSLIWSVRYKQIAATFGFGFIHNPLLLTLYSYPELKPLVHVPSPTPLRVLSAVASPNCGAICIATNDETIRFYKLWDEDDPIIRTAEVSGIYGSNIIEYVEGIDPYQTQVIR